MVNYRPAGSEDWPQIERLLRACSLPLAGAREHLGAFVVAEDAGAIVGCVGAEVYGETALLRSLAVRENARGRNIGVGLVDRLLMQLKHRHATSVALLTTTAERFFARRGFETVGRAAMPVALQASHEFNGACPANATAMLLRR